MKSLSNIVVGGVAPRLTNVLWVDTSGSSPVMKVYTSKGWVIAGGTVVSEDTGNSGTSVSLNPLGDINLWEIVNSTDSKYWSGNGAAISTTVDHTIMTEAVSTGDADILRWQVWNPNCVNNVGATNNGLTEIENRFIFLNADGDVISYADMPQLDGSTYQTGTMTIPSSVTSVKLGFVQGQSSLGDLTASKDPDIKFMVSLGDNIVDYRLSLADEIANKSVNYSETLEALGGRIGDLENTITSLESRIVDLEAGNLDEDTALEE